MTISFNLQNYQQLTLQAQLLAHSARRGHDYLMETRGWDSPGKLVGHGKCLPYVRESKYNWDSYDALVSLGNFMHGHSDVIGNVTTKFIAYAVGTGHQYEVSKRQFPMPSVGKVKPTDKQINQIRGAIDFLMNESFPNGWQMMQYETLCRYLREGCAVRRMFSGPSGITTRFVEPSMVRGPTDESLWANRTVQIPGTDVTVRALDHRLGVISTPGDDPATADMTVPIGYWLWHPVDLNNHQSPKNFTVVAATDIIHARQGVDSTDPRGLPIFWNALKHADRIERIRNSSQAMAEVRASYAVVRQYEQAYSYEALLKIASAHRDKETANLGQTVPGKEVEAKGFKYEFPDLNIDAQGFDLLILVCERNIGAVVHMPDWMISGTGAASGSQGVAASTDPFDRYVKTVQVQMARDDVRLLWEGIKAIRNWDDETLAAWKAVLDITPRFPQVISRDALKETQRVIAEVHAGLESPQGACAQLRRDYDAVQVQIDEHNQTFPDRKVVAKWEPETQIQRNKGDNVRANRQTPQGNTQ